MAGMARQGKGRAMKIIVFAKTKGGVSATSLCYNIAMMAAIKSQVFIVDLDPQGSLTRIWEKSGQLINPRLIKDVESVAKSVRLLTQAGYDREYMFVDTPGAGMHLITEAMEAADLIVLPTQPSPLDVYAQDAVAARIENLGMRKKTMVVLTRTSTKIDTDKAERHLQLRTPYKIPRMAERADYKRATETGQAAWELSSNKEVKSEIRKIWDGMQEALKAAGAHSTESRADDRPTRH
jgi:chromosome partitioning protein